MKDDDFELERGSGNLFADFGYPNADAEQLKAQLAAEIINVLNQRELTVRKAEELTSIAAADFSRIRKTKLDRFTIDRLMTVLNRLDQEVEVKVTVRKRNSDGDGYRHLSLEVKMRAFDDQEGRARAHRRITPDVSEQRDEARRMARAG